MSGTETGADDVAGRIDQLNRVGFQLFQQKLYLQALETLEQVVDLTGQLRGEHHKDLGLALLNRGRVYRLLQRNAECEADYIRALEIFQRSPGQQDQVIWLLKNLSALYLNTNRHVLAEPYTRQLLALQRASLLPGDLQLAESMVNIAFACVARGAVGEAVDLLCEALQIRSSTLGPDDPRTIQLRSILEQVQGSANSAAPAGPSASITPSTKDRFQKGDVEPILDANKLALVEADKPRSAGSSEAEGPPDNQVAALQNRARALFHQGDTRGALSLYQQVSELERAARGEHHPVYAAALYDLGAAHLVLGELTQAEEHYRQALAIQETTLGEEHSQARSTRKELAGVLAARGQLREAGTLYRRVLAEEKAAGLHHNAEWVDMATIQARFARAIGEPWVAEGLFRDALDVSQKLYGLHAENTLEITGHLVDLLIAQRRLEEAKALCSGLVEARRSAPDRLSLSDALDRLARIAFESADVASADALWKEALTALPKTPQGDGPRTVVILNRLGTLARVRGQLKEAANYFDQALEAAKKIVPEDVSLTNQTLGNRAAVLHDQGRLCESEAQYRQVLDRLLASPDADADLVAGLRNNLAMVLKSDGRFAEAESLLVQARESRRNIRGEHDPETLTGTANLGLLYYDMGLYDRAEPLLRDALTLRQQILPPGHPDLAESLQNLGELYRVTGRLDLADHLLNQALEVYRAAVGEHHPAWATAINNLALLCMARQDWVRAEELFLRAIESRRAILGEQHADLATSLDTLAGLYRATGRCSEAEPLCRRALQMRRALLGEVHPDVAWSLNNLALIAAATGRFDEADDLLRTSSAIDDQLIGQVFIVGSEAQRLRFLNHLRERNDLQLSLILRHRADRPEAARMALDLVLRRKGLAAEMLAAQRDSIGDQHDSTLTLVLEKLGQLRRDIAARTLTGPAPGESMAAHEEILARWLGEREDLEAQLARDLPQLGWDQRLREIDAAAVARALPAGSALVEYVRIEVRDFSAIAGRGQPEWQAARYVAFVLLANDPESVALVDLGEAEVLEGSVGRALVAITGDLAYARARADAPATDAEDNLRRQVFDPLLPLLSGRRRILISPDGDLATLPLEVLPWDGVYLIDRYQFSYLSCGRDLLRMQLPTRTGAGAAFVAADPDFDFAGDGGAAPPVSGRQSRDLDRGHGALRLPGTRAEGEMIARLLGVQALIGPDVVKQRFRDLHSPSILHLATHGFFLRDQTGFRATPGFPTPRIENPMLRSGLLLAGFNVWLSHGAVAVAVGDGMLNGEDVAGLDLVRTELVVLSACETGLGEIRVGEGVFGLRRAFVVAGAHTLVMSLWKVPDEQTQELMVDFYRRILAGEPRANALRQAQLAIKARWANPVYWAAFICQGDPGPLKPRKDLVQRMGDGC
jgi:CHAT domain-containing protein/tetratricopeptide (TPR) repeat protein